MKDILKLASLLVKCKNLDKLNAEEDSSGNIMMKGISVKDAISKLTKKGSKTMKILITGSDGYIGTNLCRYLIDYGHHIDYVDRKSSRDAMYYGDYHKCNAVVHLSAIAGIQKCEDNPMDAIRENVEVANRVFSWGKKTIFLSSQAAKFPSNVYAVTKFLGEKMSTFYNKRSGDIVVLRLSNVFGGDKYLDLKNSVVARFAIAYQQEGKVLINGDGSQVRDFIHVEDVCEAIRLALEYNGEPIVNPLDIGTGLATTIKELAEKFKGLEYELNGKDLVGVHSNLANPDFAKEILKFRPKKRLEDYIRTLRKQC